VKYKLGQIIAEMSHKCGSYDSELHKLQSDLSSILIKQKDKAKQLSVDHDNKLAEMEAIWSKKFQDASVEKENLIHELELQHAKDINEIHLSYKILDDENGAHKSAIAELEAQLINAMNENTNLRLNFNYAIESSASY